MKKISDYQIISHGHMYPDYFQGCGTAFTSYDEVVTGCGFTEKEAFEDALEQLAQCGVEPDIEFDGEFSDEDADEDCYWYVSVRYNAK